MTLPTSDPVEVPALYPRELYPTLKRLADVALATTITAVALPMLLLIGVLVRLTSRGPAIYSQTRVGLNGRLFQIYKVRTMHHDCERLSGPKWSTGNSDPRVTPIGRVLRRTHLDELPQLWNVLKGDMSLVGPRPERPEFVKELRRDLPRYVERLDVPPGLTGLAQVNLPPDVDRDSVRRKLAFDLHYAENIGAWLDARILLGTALLFLGVPQASLSRLLGLRPGRLARVADVADAPAPVMVEMGQAVAAWRET